MTVAFWTELGFHCLKSAVATVTTAGLVWLWLYLRHRRLMRQITKSIVGRKSACFQLHEGKPHSGVWIHNDTNTPIIIRQVVLTLVEAKQKTNLKLRYLGAEKYEYGTHVKLKPQTDGPWGAVLELYEAEAITGGYALIEYDSPLKFTKIEKLCFPAEQIEFVRSCLSTLIREDYEKRPTCKVSGVIE